MLFKPTAAITFKKTDQISKKRSLYTTTKTQNNPQPYKRIKIQNEIPNLLTKRVLYYDTETSCIHPKCGGRIVEIAALLVENGIPRKSIQMYLNPNTKSWSGAYKAHGLSEAFLRTQQQFHSVCPMIKEFFDDCDLRCAHNGRYFDDGFVNFELARAWVHDKLQTLQKDGKIKDDPNYLKSLTSAAMLYYFKEHMSKDIASEGKPGPMMFIGQNILPDPEKYPENYNAALLRLAYFKLLRVPTESIANRERITFPVDKVIKAAVKMCEDTLELITKLFAEGVLDEKAFHDTSLNSKIFDTLTHIRENNDLFPKGFAVPNLKLDSLLDYYDINRYDRETGSHGAGIDTNLLFQFVRKMFGHKYGDDTFLHKMSLKPQKHQENYFFKKNSILHFDENGMIECSRTLFDDGVCSTFGDPYNYKPVDIAMSIKPVAENGPFTADDLKITKIIGNNIEITKGDWTFSGIGTWTKK